MDGVPVRIYEPEGEPTGLMVYFHGGGMCVGSIASMDNVAREIADVCGAVVVSVEYRLAPENPFPAGLDDCDAVDPLGARPDRALRRVAGQCDRRR